jgi:hypothetical protein
MTDKASYSLQLAFDRDSQDFVLGVEVGAEFERLRSNEGPIEAIMHAENAEMVLRMAEAAWRPVQSEEMGDGWLQVRFGEPMRDSGFAVGDRVVVNSNVGTVTDPRRSAAGTILVKFDDGPLAHSLLSLVERA